MRLLLAIVTVAAFILPQALAAPTAHAGEVIDHAPFDALLKEFVDRRGRVDYTGLTEDEEAHTSLNAYVAAIGDANPKGHSRPERLTFYINAYNATVIHAVLEDVLGTAPSVMKVDGFFKKTTHTVAGKEMTLDHLEHKLIRPTFKEARVHFVLVCAAVSCPRLRRQALTSKNLEGVLERATTEFVNKATSIDDGTITTSKLFEWFASDFSEFTDVDSVKAFLAKYYKGEDKDALADEDAQLTYSPYDWALNAR